MTVKELLENLEDYGEHLPVVIVTPDGQFDLDSIGSGALTIKDHEKEGMTGVFLYTID